MAEYTIAAVPLNLVSVMWPLCKGHIQRAIDRLPTDTNIDVILDRIVTDEVMLIAVIREGEVVAALTFEVNHMANDYRILYVSYLGGYEMEGWLNPAMEMGMNVARKLNCSELRSCAVRRGWLKKLEKYNWSEKFTVLGALVEKEE